MPRVLSVDTYDESYIWENSLYKSYTSHATANSGRGQFVLLTYAKLSRTAILGTEESGLGRRLNQENVSTACCAKVVAEVQLCPEN